MPRDRRGRSLSAVVSCMVLAALTVVPTAPAAASTQPGEPTDLVAVSAVMRAYNEQDGYHNRTDSYMEWQVPDYTANITCYYVRWRVASKNGQPAGAWQPSEQGAIARYGTYYEIDGLTIGETYDFEVRSYSESLGAYSDWVTLNKTLTDASTDSSLTSLTLSAGTLSPTFDPQEWWDVTYTATVPNSH